MTARNTVLGFAISLLVAGAAHADALQYVGSGGQGDWRTGIRISDEAASRRSDWSLVQIDDKGQATQVASNLTERGCLLVARRQLLVECGVDGLDYLDDCPSGFAPRAERCAE